MLISTLFLNAVLAVSLAAPALPAAVSGAAPAVLPRESAAFRGGSVRVPFTPCDAGVWWDGLCTESCDARVCVMVIHVKLVCGSTVVFDFAWMEVTVEEDGSPPRGCRYGLGDLPKGGPYPEKTYRPDCGAGRIVLVDLGWNGDEPEIRSLACIE